MESISFVFLKPIGSISSSLVSRKIACKQTCEHYIQFSGHIQRKTKRKQNIYVYFNWQSPVPITLRGQQSFFPCCTETLAQSPPQTAQQQTITVSIEMFPLKKTCFVIVFVSNIYYIFYYYICNENNDALTQSLLNNCACYVIQKHRG